MIGMLFGDGRFYPITRKKKDKNYKVFRNNEISCSGRQSIFQNAQQTAEEKNVLRRVPQD
jgi:hypothetical protein